MNILHEVQRMQLLTSFCPIHSYLHRPICVFARLQCCLWSLLNTDAGLAAAAGLRVLQLLLLDQVCKTRPLSDCVLMLFTKQMPAASQTLVYAALHILCLALSTSCTTLSMLQTCAAATLTPSAA